MTRSDPEPVRSAQIVELIRVEALTGTGVAGDPCRLITAYYQKTGELLCVVDPCKAAR